MLVDNPTMCIVCIAIKHVTTRWTDLRQQQACVAQKTDGPVCLANKNKISVRPNVT